MKRSTEFMLCSSLLLTYFGFVCWFFSMSIVQHNCPDMALYPLMPAIALIVILIVDTFAISRGISLSVYIALQIGFSVLLGILFFHSTYIAENGIGSRVTASILCAVGGICSALIAMEPPKKVSLTVCFDCCLIMLALLFGLNQAIGIPIYAVSSAVLIVAVFVTLVTLIKVRIDSEGVTGTAEGNPIAGRLLIIAVFAAVVIVVLLIVILAKGGIQSFSELCLALFNLIISGIKTAAAFLYRMFEQFMQFLASLFPAEDGPMGLGGEPAAAMGPPQETTERGSLPPWFGYVFLGIITAVIVFILFKLRRHKVVVTRSIRRRVNKGTRTNGFVPYIKSLVRKFIDGIVFEFNCIRFRSTAPGLLVWCQRKNRRKLARLPGESGENYLIRLSSFTTGESAQALAELSKLVEKSFYSPGPVNVPRNISSAVRKARFEIK